MRSRTMSTRSKPPVVESSSTFNPRPPVATRRDCESPTSHRRADIAGHRHVSCALDLPRLPHSVMTFGKPSGPPASAQQMRRLEELLRSAGHADFRDARGPLGLNQRQAAGRFTREEADSFIQLLESNSDHSPDFTASEPTGPQPKMTEAERRVRTLPDSLLAAELQRRGWIVVEP